MSTILKEYIQTIIQEKLRSSKFNINYFKSLDDINEIFNYAYDNLEFLGAGSSRATFPLSSGKALKIANWDAVLKGIAQNKVEIKTYTKTKNKDFIAKIFDHDQDYQWIISELVKPINDETEFLSLLDIKPSDGIDFELLMMLAKLGPEKTKNVEEKENFYLPQKANDFIEGIDSLRKNHNMEFGDLDVIGHWGKTNDDRLVLLDYGYDSDVRQAHYNQPENFIGSATNKLEK